MDGLKQNPFRADIETHEYASFVPRKSAANIVEGHFIHVIGAAYSDECSEIYIGITGKGGTASEARERAYKAWNTRNYPPEAQQAVERMKPKRPMYAYEGTGKCPSCRSLVERNPLYDKQACDRCGQALDWSE